MPPRLSVQLRAATRWPQDAPVCPECSRKEFWKPNRRPIAQRLRRFSEQRSSEIQVSAQSKQQSRRERSNPRNAAIPNSQNPAPSTRLTSDWVINASTTIPPAHLELYERLRALRDAAGSFMDLARIELALKSLESTQPVTRVALLGLGPRGMLAARNLARVLLSDPLSDEQPWEWELAEPGNYTQSLLLRYGDVDDSVQKSPLVRTMHIPSLFLQRNNVEIMVTTLNANESEAGVTDGAELRDVIHVPSLATQTSVGGRPGFVRYPVHRTIVVAEGVTGAVQYGSLARYLTGNELINTVLSLPVRSGAEPRSREESTNENVVDVDLASNALSLFRADNANGAEFNDQWQRSGIPGIIHRIAVPPEASQMAVVCKLVDSILDNTSKAIVFSQEEGTIAIADRIFADKPRRVLIRHISRWSREAHSDLQIQFELALTSLMWRRTVWWRLFWRIDDVSSSAADLLRGFWLADAEQRLAFLCGQLIQAGFATSEEFKLSEPGLDEETKTSLARYLDEKKDRETTSKYDVAQTVARAPEPLSTLKLKLLLETPWPTTIERLRLHMLGRMVPELHVKAQAALFSSLSIIGGGSALGVWSYIASGGLTSESGAIVALGLVWGLRRLQLRWSAERKRFEDELRESGRIVIASLTERMMDFVNRDKSPKFSMEDRQEWDASNAAVERCREANDRLRKSL